MPKNVGMTDGPVREFSLMMIIEIMNTRQEQCSCKLSGALISHCYVVDQTVASARAQRDLSQGQYWFLQATEHNLIA